MANKFKIGDKVEQIEGGWSTDSQDNGKEAIVKDIAEDHIEIKRIGEWKYYSKWVNVKGFKLIPTLKTWETLEKGDILIRIDDSPHEVAEIMGEIVFTLYSKNRHVCIYTKELLRSYGYSIKQEEQPLEVSLEEVAKKFGVTKIEIIK